jgi:hypothetical protein
VRQRPSRLAASITAGFLLGGAVVVASAVRGVVVDPRDDASWVAIVFGLSLAAWGVTFHRLGSRGSDAVDDDGPVLRDPLGSVALFAVVGTGAYWASRSLLGHSAVVAVAVAATIVGLQALNRRLDAVLARRRADGDEDEGGAGPAVPVD